MFIAFVTIKSSTGEKEAVFAASSAPELFTLLSKKVKNNLKADNGETLTLKSLCDIGPSVSPTTLKNLGVVILSRKDVIPDITPNPAISHTPMDGFSKRKLYQLGEVDPDDYSPGRNFED